MSSGESVKIKCPCGYTWEYTGKMTEYCSCPNCRRSLKIDKYRVDDDGD